MMWGISKKFIVLFFIMISIILKADALEKIGIITDAILTPANYYNSYFKTPDFFADDIRYELIQKNVSSVPLDITQTALKKAYLRQYDLEALQNLQGGYNLQYPLLKKIAKAIGVKKLVVITMGMEIQRDFLKNTLWNSLNISGMDVVNPTHRVSVYVALVDVNREIVLWESIYAKNIRNNKMKNLDTTISGNYEGMLRLKEYSKYISPDVAYNVKMKMLNPNFVEPPTAITKENLMQYAKDKHNIGVKKELSEIDRKKWDDKKLKEDTKNNIIEVTNNTKDGIIKAGKSTKSGFIKVTNSTKSGFMKMKNKIKKTKPVFN